MNPWLKIPLDDYEAHMALDSVMQAQFLADTLGKLAAATRPKSVAILGCSGGNGFDRLVSSRVERVVGVDINPRYIETAGRRFESRFDRLELICADFLSPECTFAPVDLIFAGLFFEYIDYRAALRSIPKFINPGGCLSAILQLPSDSIGAVTPSDFIKLEMLESIFKFIPPDEFCQSAIDSGLTVDNSEVEVLKSGKSFHIFQFSNT